MYLKFYRRHILINYYSSRSRFLAQLNFPLQASLIRKKLFDYLAESYLIYPQMLPPPGCVGDSVGWNAGETQRIFWQPRSLWGLMLRICMYKRLYIMIIWVQYVNSHFLQFSQWEKDLFELLEKVCLHWRLGVLINLFVPLLHTCEMENSTSLWVSFCTPFKLL